MILPPSFYEQETIAVATQLLGCRLVHLEAAGTICGKIVETEAYLVNDSAAHSFIGKTKRNNVLFGPVGHAYMYFVYGMHYCVNVVTGEEGSGEAVLIRALEPLKGIPVMEKRRGTGDLRQLCSGPAKLAQAFGITLTMNGAPLFEGPLQIRSPDTLPDQAQQFAIEQTTRIGIVKSRELPLRFYIRGNRFISRK